MCVVCGCSDVGREPLHAHQHAHALADARTPDLDFGADAARVSVPGLSSERAIRLEASVLGANDAVARANRSRFAAHGVVAYNFVSSPGAGKTTLLVATIEALRRQHPRLPLAVIEGDQHTSHDADRIRATGVRAVQVNTGKGCHLDAPMVAAACEHLRDALERGADGRGSLLLIENVGNLVCPAMWDLGERAKVAILSVTEGDDKPIKYPDMFAAAKLIVLTKVDLLPHVDFDVARCIDYALRVNPGIEVLLLSAKTGEGMDAWLEWLLDAVPMPAAAATGAAHEITA